MMVDEVDKSGVRREGKRCWSELVGVDTVLPSRHFILSASLHYGMRSEHASHSRKSGKRVFEPARNQSPARRRNSSHI